MRLCVEKDASHNEASVSQTRASTQIRSRGPTSWPLTLTDRDSGAAANATEHTHILFNPAATLSSRPADIQLLGCRSSRSLPSLYPPRLVVTPKKSVKNWAELQWRVEEEEEEEREGEEEKEEEEEGDNLYTSSRTCGEWGGEINGKKGELEDKSGAAERRKGSVGFKKTKKGGAIKTVRAGELMRQESREGERLQAAGQLSSPVSQQRADGAWRSPQARPNAHRTT